MGDVKFADNETTMIYFANEHNGSTREWYFNHNIEINKNITEKIASKYVYADDMIIHYFVGLPHNSPVEWRYPEFNEFARSLVWVDGVIRLTDESVDIILASNQSHWNFNAIFAHMGIDDRYNTTVTFYTVCRFLEKFSMPTVDFYKMFPHHREELKKLGHKYGWAKSASIEEIEAHVNDWNDMLDVYENPNLSLDFILSYPDRFVHPSRYHNLTLKDIRSHPEVRWSRSALYHIKITDENIDEFLNHRLLDSYCIGSNTTCTLKYAWRIAEKLADRDGYYAEYLIQEYMLSRRKVNIPREFLNMLPHDWDGNAKSLSWKFVVSNYHNFRTYLIGRSKYY